MPIYAYRCAVCGHEVDALQKLADAPLTDCPACGAAALKKQLTAPAFRLKGTGWYETDFKKDGKRNLHESDDGAKGPAEKSADGKADGKPSDGKADGKPSDGKVDSKPAADKTSSAASAANTPAAPPKASAS